MAYALRKQPFRGIYITLRVLLDIALRVPLWCLYYIPKRNRPRPAWSWYHCIEIDAIREGNDLGPIAERAGPILPSPNHLAIPNDKTLKAVWLEPVPKLVHGEVRQWAAAANVQSISIPGYWYDKEGYDTAVGEPPMPGEKVLYYIHGGGFIAYSAHPCVPVYSYITRRLMTCHSSVRRALSVEYRLVVNPFGDEVYPFPAALLDTLAGYTRLVNAGFRPEDIILAGDSAGANLALALVRYLIESRRDPVADKVVPHPPSALVLVSPWADLGTSHDGPNSSLRTKLSSDYLRPVDSGLLYYARQNYSGPLGFPGGPNDNPYLSPASVHPGMPRVSFEGFPPTIIVMGEAETFSDQIETLWHKMSTQMGDSQVALHVAKDAPHAFMILSSWEEQNNLAYDVVARWFEKLSQ
ncbi:unnamed protein product [Somion occarium]|uniref:Alpha/beta hydrolase fold-3 domain-containing protein n=1 Tax=Somion occarium TaxID=3059160 RepID=A0ABP1DJ74_9APHY